MENWGENLKGGDLEHRYFGGPGGGEIGNCESSTEEKIDGDFAYRDGVPAKGNWDDCESLSRGNDRVTSGRRSPYNTVKRYPANWNWSEDF